jgi:hypothetical protein
VRRKPYRKKVPYPVANNNVVSDGPGYGILDLRKIWGLGTEEKSVLGRNLNGTTTDLFVDDDM